MKISTVYGHKKGYVEVSVPKKALVFERGIVSRKEAQRAYIESFLKSARKKRHTKYKGSKGFEFTFR